MNEIDMTTADSVPVRFGPETVLAINPESVVVELGLRIGKAQVEALQSLNPGDYPPADLLNNFRVAMNDIVRAEGKAQGVVNLPRLNIMQALALFVQLAEQFKELDLKKKLQPSCASMESNPQSGSAFPIPSDGGCIPTCPA